MEPLIPPRLPLVTDWRAALRRKRLELLWMWGFLIGFFALMIWLNGSFSLNEWPLAAIPLTFVALSIWTGRAHGRDRDYRAAGLAGGDRSVIAAYPPLVQKGLLRALEAGAREGGLMPPGYRLLWRLGISLPPPAFAGFLTRFLILYGTVFVTIPLWLLISGWGDHEPGGRREMAYIGMVLLAIIFALICAESERKALGLPTWRDFCRMNR